MKNHIAILCTALLVFGCSQNSRPQNTQSQKQEPEKWDFESVVWYHNLYTTNVQLTIFTENGIITNHVGSLESVAQYLGEYGWEVIRVGSEDDNRVLYLKRNSQTYGTFTLGQP
jgi:ABC-type enterochelin transport system substrate-binding protein